MQETHRVDALDGLQDLTAQTQRGADAEGSSGHAPPQVGQVTTLKNHSPQSEKKQQKQPQILRFKSLLYERLWLKSQWSLRLIQHQEENTKTSLSAVSQDVLYKTEIKSQRVLNGGEGQETNLKSVFKVRAAEQEIKRLQETVWNILKETS